MARDQETKTQRDKEKELKEEKSREWISWRADAARNKEREGIMVRGMIEKDEEKRGRWIEEGNKRVRH